MVSIWWETKVVTPQFFFLIIIIIYSSTKQLILKYSITALKIEMLSSYLNLFKKRIWKNLLWRVYHVLNIVTIKWTKYVLFHKRNLYNINLHIPKPHCSLRLQVYLTNIYYIFPTKRFGLWYKRQGLKRLSMRANNIQSQ